MGWGGGGGQRRELKGFEEIACVRCAVDVVVEVEVCSVDFSRER